MKEQNESVKKLEVGKDYISLLNSSIIVIDRKSNYENGFRHKEFKSYLLCADPENWREATEEQVIAAFEKHLIERYGEDWRTMKIKEVHPSLSSSVVINDGDWDVFIAKRPDGWSVWNKNGLLYRNGVWVERLEEEPKTQIQDPITEKNLDSFPDIDLVLELRKRGYEVTAEKTITIKL